MRRNVGKKQQRRRQAAFILMEVVLRDPGAVKTVAFGVASSSRRVKNPRRFRVMRTPP